jgi:hypothetical protein
MSAWAWIAQHRRQPSVVRARLAPSESCPVCGQEVLCDSVRGPKPADIVVPSDPAIARIGIAWAKRLKNMTIPIVALYHGGFALSPAKAEPLSAAIEA